MIEFKIIIQHTIVLLEKMVLILVNYLFTICKVIRIQKYDNFINFDLLLFMSFMCSPILRGTLHCGTQKVSVDDSEWKSQVHFILL